MSKPTYQTTDFSKMAHSAMTFTEGITHELGARLVGSDACLRCGEFLKKTLTSFCDHTDSQDFSVRPGAFLGYIRINIVLYFLSLIALFFQQVGLATGIASLAVLVTVLEFFIYKEFVDFLFPEKKGKNVWGTIEPAGEVKQQIIISAHHDSAHIFNFLEKDPTTYPIKVLGGTLTQLSMLIVSWGIWIAQMAGAEFTTTYWVLTGILTVAGVLVGQLWFFYSKEGTPGAGDNLVCTALAIEIGRYFASQKAEGNGLKHTRVMIASWDGEECGLRGARAYTKAHKTALQETKTYNFNLECMYDHQEMSFLVSDLNNFVPLSTEMADVCVATANQLGYDTGTTKFPFLGGGTDAAEFAKIGVEATTLIAMNWHVRDKNSAYHTTRDTIEAVDQEAVARSIEIGIEYVKEMDNEA